MDWKERVIHLPFSIDCTLNKQSRFYGQKQTFCWKCYKELFYKPSSPPSSPISSPRKI